MPGTPCLPAGLLLAQQGSEEHAFASKVIHELGIKVTPHSIDALGTVMDGLFITAVTANVEDTWPDAGAFMLKRTANLVTMVANCTAMEQEAIDPGASQCGLGSSARGRPAPRMLRLQDDGGHSCPGGKTQGTSCP